MFQEDVNLVKVLAREIAREEIEKALARFAPPVAPSGLKVDLPAKAASRAANTETP